MGVHEIIIIGTGIVLPLNDQTWAAVNAVPPSYENPHEEIQDVMQGSAETGPIFVPSQIFSKASARDRLTMLEISNDSEYEKFQYCQIAPVSRQDILELLQPFLESTSMWPILQTQGQPGLFIFRYFVY